MVATNPSCDKKPFGRIHGIETMERPILKKSPGLSLLVVLLLGVSSVQSLSAQNATADSSTGKDPAVSSEEKTPTDSSPSELRASQDDAIQNASPETKAEVAPVDVIVTETTTPEAMTDLSSEEDGDLVLPAPTFGKQSGAAVFKRLRKNFAGPVCDDTPEINAWKKRYAGNRPAFSTHLRDMLPLLDYVSQEVERRKLPSEYALIPIIESRYQPHAIGVGGPAGLWQMIGSTAKNHGVKIQNGYDGRFSVIDSTDAALSYLKTLDGMFPDWKRSVMGYNAGEFRVLRAMKNSSQHAGQDHWPQGLSAITYAYISKIQALSCVLAQPKAFGLTLPNDSQFTPLSVVMVEENIHNLDKMAKRLNIDAQQLKGINPAYKNGQIGTAMPRRVLIPKINAQANTTDTAQEDEAGNQTVSETNTVDSQKNPMRHHVKAGDTLSKIAKRYGLGLKTLRSLNDLGSNAVLHIGQELKLGTSD
jgi:membrane-bound lytic murein transglycosylase D